jgi:DNA-binding NtrC family response regulator
MCRTADSGAYELGNIRIDTGDANLAERSAMAASARQIQQVAGIMRLPLPDRIARFERRLVCVALQQTNGSVTNAAFRLGITLRQMRYLVARHKIDRKTKK